MSGPYEQFLEYTSSFFGGRREPRARRVPFLVGDRFRALDYAFRTVPIAARFPHREEQQWNPFHQRLLVHELDVAGWRAAEPFARANTASIAIAEAVHELVHILLWEPFFCGHERILGLEQFGDLSLIMEAYCFWFGEDFALRAPLRYPDGSPVFHKHSSLSAPDFHPFEVMREEGVTRPAEVLETFLRGFRGYESRLLRFRSRLGLELRNTIYGFHRHNAIAIRRHHRLAREMGLFDRFWTDFCEGARGRADLAVFAVDELRYDALREDPQRVVALPRLLARAERGGGRRNLDRIRARRRVQARAYVLLSDLHLARHGNLLDARGLSPITAGERAAFVTALEADYATLAAVWRRFLAAPARVIETGELAVLDRTVDAHYRARRHFRVGSKRQIYPAEGLPEHAGLLPESVSSRRSLRLVHATLKARYLSEDAPTSEGLRRLEKLERILETPTWSATSARAFRRQHAAFVKRHSALWPLGQGFRDERFTEHGFVYR